MYPSLLFFFGSNHSQIMYYLYSNKVIDNMVIFEEVTELKLPLFDVIGYLTGVQMSYLLAIQQSQSADDLIYLENVSATDPRMNVLFCKKGEKFPNPTFRVEPGMAIARVTRHSSIIACDVSFDYAADEVRDSSASLQQQRVLPAEVDFIPQQTRNPSMAQVVFMRAMLGISTTETCDEKVIRQQSGKQCVGASNFWPTNKELEQLRTWGLLRIADGVGSDVVTYGPTPQGIEVSRRLNNGPLVLTSREYQFEVKPRDAWFELSNVSVVKQNLDIGYNAIRQVMIALAQASGRSLTREELVKKVQSANVSEQDARQATRDLVLAAYVWPDWTNDIDSYSLSHLGRSTDVAREALLNMTNRAEMPPADTPELDFMLRLVCNPSEYHHCDSESLKVDQGWYKLVRGYGIIEIESLDKQYMSRLTLKGACAIDRGDFGMLKVNWSTERMGMIYAHLNRTQVGKLWGDQMIETINGSTMIDGIVFVFEHKQLVTRLFDEDKVRKSQLSADQYQFISRLINKRWVVEIWDDAGHGYFELTDGGRVSLHPVNLTDLYA